MKFMGCWAALFLVLIAPWRLLAATQCGAFGQDGTFASARIQGSNLEVTLASPATAEKSYSLASGEARICRVSFSSDDQFLAVSLVRPTASTREIAVALLNLKTGSWVGDKPVQPNYSQFPGGFVGDTHTFATAFLSGIWERGSSLRFQVFTIEAEKGAIGKSILRPLDGPPSSLFPNSFDTAHNQLWNRLQGTACGLHGISVLDEKSSFNIPTTAFPDCTNLGLVEFPTAEYVVIASQNQESVRLWRLTLSTKHAETLDLPADASQALQLMDLSAHSADGAVVALAVKVLAKDRFGGLHPGTNSVAIVSTSSWTLLSIYDLKLATLSQLAVDHHDGKVTVEANDGTHWVRFSDVR